MHVSSPSPELLRTIPVRYYVFDLLMLDGKSTTALPYAERRVMLGELGLDGESIRTPPSFLAGEGLPVLQAAEIGGFEGVVAKRLTAPYRPGKRSADWTKVPLIHTQEVLIIGWEAGEGRRSGTIGSLLLGVVEGGDLRYAGQVGTGFTDEMLGQLRERLEPLGRATAAVADVPREHARHARWVEPALVGEVAYRNWTPDGRLRHASWRGLRPDRGVEAARVPSARPTFSPHESEVTGALATNDGRWRVEVVSQDGEESFRVLHDDNTVDGLSLAQVQEVLHEAGIDLGDLADAVA
jgi:bifunctional non-homologous end joining protein LigD